MGRPLLPCAVTLAALAVGGRAEAGPTRKVTVETTPPGATVYLESVDNGPACQPTPCQLDAPIGQTPVILQLSGFSEKIDLLDVPKKGRLPAFKFTLDRAIATLKFAAPKGASVRVDEEDKGKIPATVEVSGDEGHHVIVTQNGKTLFDDYVTVASNDELAIDVKGGGGGSAKPNGGGGGSDTVAVSDDGGGDGSDGGGGGGDGSGDGATGDGGITKPATPGGPRPTAVILSAVFDIGFRDFTWDKGTNGTTNNRDESEAGQVVAGASVEVYPLALAGASKLTTLSVYLHYGRGINPQPVMGSKLKTYWDNLEVSGRFKKGFGKLAIEVGAGYIREQYRFSGDVTDVENAPDAAYGSVRIGGRLSVRAGKLEPFLGFENRIVLDGGNIASRFSSAQVSGYRAALGANARFGKLGIRVEAALLRYNWTFDPQPMDTYRAAAGADKIEMITTSIGYVY